MTSPQPPDPNPIQRVSSQHPGDPAWRADALAASRHSRLLDELRLPAEDRDPERAERLCAEIARIALREYAPALILLSPDLRRRTQALTSYVLTLFDFATQGGLEGERLAQLNRWEFNLELALDGNPPGQPVFVRMSHEESRRPWPREALDGLAQAARRRITRPRPPTAAAVAREAEALAHSLAVALLGDGDGPQLVPLGALLVRLRGLQQLGHDLVRGRARLPVDELPEPPTAGGERRLAEAIAAECERLRELLAATTTRQSLPAEIRASVRYLRGAAGALLRLAERGGTAIVDRAPVLGLWRRVGLLLRARFGA